MMNLNRTIVSIGVGSSLLILLSTAPKPEAQDEGVHLRVNVDLVQLNIAVTDPKGNYVSGLKPTDFQITEDKIQQKISTFEEGNGPSQRVGESDADASAVAAPGAMPVASDKGAAASPSSSSPAPASSFEAAAGLTGANVFILFDTSNYMYRGFVFAQDAIADFVRSLDASNKVAFYSYSRNLSRGTALTPDRFQVVNGVRSTVAGDDAALYNSLLLTVKDAAHLTGRKAIVVFSNGPDNASSVPPEDVAELAQSTGTIIYIVSTRLAEEEPISTAAFARVSKATGGKAYFARNWRDEKEAFTAIREDISHLYTISYYPQFNPNRGWRNITVKLTGPNVQKYRIRTRDGYRLLQPTATADSENLTAAAPEVTSEPTAQ